MQENISEKSGFVRLALGTGLTAFGIAHLVKESGSKSLGTALVAAGAMKVAEGIFLYCPMKALLNSNVKEAVYTSFDEYLDGDNLMRAYNDSYQNKWGSSSSNSQSSHSSWSEGGLAQVAKQAMESVASGDTPVQAAVQAATSMSGAGNQSNSSQNSQSGNQSKSSQKGQTGNQSDANFENVASQAIQSIANGDNPTQALAQAAAQTISNSSSGGGQSKSSNNNGGKSKSSNNNGQSATNPS